MWPHEPINMLSCECCCSDGDELGENVWSPLYLNFSNVKFIYTQQSWLVLSWKCVSDLQVLSEIACLDCF